MANESVALQIEVKGAMTIKDLKQSIKDAKNELLQFEAGTEGFARAQAKVSKLTDTLKDLGDSAKIQGTGIERLQQSFGLLGESFRAGDLEKGKLALTGIGQAVKAIPIFLLVEGIQYLINNFDKLVEFIPGLQKIVDLFDSMTDAIGLTHNAVTKVLEENIAKTKELTEQTQDYYDREVALLKASGQETFLIEQQKRADIIETLNAQIHAINLRDAAEGKSSDEAKQLIDQRKKLQLEMDVAEVEFAEKRKKELADQLEAQRKLNAEALKKTLERLDAEEKLFYQKQGAELKREADAAAEKEKQRLEAEKAYLDKQAELDKQFAELAKAQKDKDLQDEIDRNKKAVEDRKKSEEAKKNAVIIGISAAAGLSAAYFATQLAHAKGNQAEELKIRKQMFEVDKAFNVARAVQDGIRSVQAALTIPPPGGQILAGVNGALAAANVAKILSTTFDAGASSASITGGAASSLPSTSGSVPTITPNNSITQTTLNGGSNNQTVSNQSLTVKAYVVESEMTQSQRIVERIRRTASHG